MKALLKIAPANASRVWTWPGMHVRLSHGRLTDLQGG